MRYERQCQTSPSCAAILGEHCCTAALAQPDSGSDVPSLLSAIWAAPFVGPLAVLSATIRDRHLPAVCGRVDVCQDSVAPFASGSYRRGRLLFDNAIWGSASVLDGSRQARDMTVSIALWAARTGCLLKECQSRLELVSGRRVRPVRARSQSILRRTPLVTSGAGGGGLDRTQFSTVSARDGFHGQHTSG